MQENGEYYFFFKRNNLASLTYTYSSSYGQNEGGEIVHLCNSYYICSVYVFTYLPTILFYLC